jgi:acid phosphatase type 7
VLPDEEERLHTPRAVTIAISLALLAATSMAWTHSGRAAPSSDRMRSLGLEMGCTIVGTGGDDQLRGTSGPDVICGAGGDDLVRGIAGDDVIRGGLGRDVILGGSGVDLVKGGAGDDRLRGNRDDDALHGGGGRDTLIGGPDDDHMRGGALNDDIEGSDGVDTIAGNAGDDDLDALDGHDQDVVQGQGGSDSCLADRGDTVETCERGGTPPPAPTGLDGQATASRVDLDWTGSPDATEYRVFRDGVALATASGSSYGDTTVEPETGYSYQVQASNDSGASPLSAPFAITTPARAEGTTIVMAAGDIACDPADSSFRSGNGTSTSCRQRHTAELLSGADHVLTLGDHQYECGGLSAFQQSYDLSWGRYLAITHPILADEEYGSTGTGCGASGPDGYLTYFADQLATHGPSASDPDRGYYSFDIGEWHVVALNTECSRIPGGCGQGGAQNEWLEADLADSNARCTIALMHQPRFASKKSGDGLKASVRPLWQDLYDQGVEMVLSGDSHWYERFAPQAPDATADPDGIVQWIVGTGGKSHGGLAPEGSRRAHSVTAVSSTFGVLRLELNHDGYAWRYKVEGSSSYTDTGDATCH